MSNTPTILIAVGMVSLFSAGNAFCQTESGGSEPLTLEQALSLIELENFDIAAADIAIERAATLDEEAASLWRPRVDVSAAYTFFDREAELTIPDVYTPILPYLGAVAAADPSLPPLEQQLGSLDFSHQVVRHQHDVRASLTVQQPLFQPLASPLRAQAEAVRREAQHGRAQALFELRGAVQELYFQALAQQRIVEVCERNVALAELQLERISVAAREGVAGSFEVNRAEVAVARAERDRDTAEAAYSLMIDALAELLNVDPVFDVTAPPVVSAERVERATPSAERAEVLRELAARDRLVATSDQAFAEALPMVVVEASANGQRESAFDDPFSWYVRVGLQWSLYDGGSRRARRDRAELEAAEAEVRAEQTRARAEAERRRALTQIDLATLSVLQASREADFAERNVEVTQEAWVVGEAGFVDVETAREQLWLAELALANAEVTQQAAIYEWQRQVGQ
ncbi:MAG: TolC family protein [Myxococcales bacterium]|nr:TolC family protein [Myxococcales bacterium]